MHYFRESIETDIALHSTFILIKHKIVPMDLVLIEQPKSRVYSFLSVTWGLLADIDYESEKFRAIGEARFTLQAIRRIIGLCFCRISVAVYSSMVSTNFTSFVTSCLLPLTKSPFQNGVNSKRREFITELLSINISP